MTCFNSRRGRHHSRRGQRVAMEAVGVVLPLGRQYQRKIERRRTQPTVISMVVATLAAALKYLIGSRSHAKGQKQRGAVCAEASSSKKMWRRGGAAARSQMTATDLKFRGKLTDLTGVVSGQYQANRPHTC
jgi:hypothetical protein